jgi:hypothetical protein
MKVLCPSCRVPVAAEDVALDTGLAKCRTCNNVFRFDDHPELATPGARPRQNVGRPKSVATWEDNGGLTVQYRWFSPKYVAMALFCLVWDGFLVFWYLMAWGSGNWLMMLFPLLHLAAGIFITYATIAGFVNTTTLRIDPWRLRVAHHPLPWGRPVDLEVVDVEQLFCDEKITRGKNGPTYTYNLNALLSDGSRRKVISGLDSPELPLFLEQHSEAWLGIRDEQVAGELPR